MALSPTQRTLRALRNRGLICEIVEKFISFPSPGHRKDLFGIIDILALSQDGIIGIQSCGDSFGQHLQKIKETELTEEWLNTPGTSLELWAWSKRKRKLSKGYSKDLYWQARVEVITLENLHEDHTGRL